MENEAGRETKAGILYFSLSFAVIFIISFLVLFFLEKELRLTRTEEMERQEQRIVKLENDFIARELGMVLSDLHYLHHAFKSGLSDPRNHAVISANWTEFSSQRRIYDQIRYLDAGGNEKIRINFGTGGGYAVPQRALQNKKDRYYFTETVRLAEDKVYISPLDLNIENGAIEIPFKPVIRLSTPLYDDAGSLTGIIVLNYLADSSLSGFRDLAGNSQGEIILLNSNGYRLSSADPGSDWNFMFETKKLQNFEKEYPLEWKSIVAEEGQFTTPNGLFTASTVALRHKFTAKAVGGHDADIFLGDGSWYIVSVIQRNSGNRTVFGDETTALVLDVLKKNLLYFALMAVISGLAGFIASVRRRAYSRIKYYSEYDPLTKTLNRRAGITKLNELIHADDRRGALGSLCFIDINGLKEVNDTLGHKQGDELIKTASDIIQHTIRDDDFLVRLGGDEFLIVFRGIGMEIAENIWSRVVRRFNLINETEGRHYLISVSHGIVDFGNRQKMLVDDLIQNADEKMYKEKQIIKVGLHVVRLQAAVRQDRE